MDVLADFLDVAGVVAQLGVPLSGDKDWTQRVAAKVAFHESAATTAGRLYLYAAARGQCCFVADDAERSLSRGDAIFVLEGLEHQLKAPSEDIRIVTAQIEFTSGSIGLSTLGMPETLSVPASEDSHSSELVCRLGKEMEEKQGGWKSVCVGIVNALFIVALRAGGACAESNQDGHGWLRGMADEEIGAALQLLHERPEHRWTVAELANELSVSRSAFAARFKTITGRPPLEYLTWWRLQRAARRLRSGDVTLAEVARYSGYQSDAAFGKAFRREFGISPGQFRRQTQARSQASSQLQLELKKRDPFSVLEQEAGLNLIKTAELIKAQFLSLLDSHQLVGPEYNILRILRGQAIPQTQEQLEKQLLVHEGDIQPHLGRLIAAKLICLLDHDDLLAITERGTELLAKMDSPILSLHRRQFSQFSDGELEELNRLLVKARNPVR